MNDVRSVNLPESSAHFFLDSNILVYSFDQRDQFKQSVARFLIAKGLTTRLGVISTQNVQEFLNVALRKFSQPMSLSQAQTVLDKILMPLCRHVPSVSFYHQVMLVQAETGYSFYDSMVISAAIATNCEYLFSEDLQNGQTIRGVNIINPFVGK